MKNTNTAILLIIFNRPDLTERVFLEISKAKPKKLFVACDGPRLDRTDDVEKINATRAIIDRVDWPCEVYKKYSPINLGCKLGPASAISWIFEHVEDAIILEDDCIPDQSFFPFCEEMLDRYRDNKHISMVSGDNFQFGKNKSVSSYYFSKYCLTWGWATWRDRWVPYYDLTMSKWPKIRDANLLSDLIRSKSEVPYWAEIFERVYTRKLDTAWDYQWFFSNLLEGRLSIAPSVNLISNIGAGQDATHTILESSVLNVPSGSLNFPLVHPVGIFRDIDSDRNTNEVYFKLTIPVRIKNKFMRVSSKFKFLLK